MACVTQCHYIRENSLWICFVDNICVPITSRCTMLLCIRRQLIDGWNIRDQFTFSLLHSRLTANAIYEFPDSHRFITRTPSLLMMYLVSDRYKKIIEQKYLTNGHTQIECDRVSNSIELHLGKPFTMYSKYFTCRCAVVLHQPTWCYISQLEPLKYTPDLITNYKIDPNSQ